MLSIRQVETEADVGELLLRVRIVGQQLNRSKQRLVSRPALLQFDGCQPQAVVRFAVSDILLDGGPVIQSRILILACREELVSLRYIGLLRRAASARCNERDYNNARAHNSSHG